MEIPTQPNSVTKEVTKRNRNNRLISYIKTLFGIDTLDMDRSYLVNYLYFLLSIDPFFLYFLLSFLMTKELISYNDTFSFFFATHF
jgi:hypothetical protein